MPADTSPRALAIELLAIIEKDADHYRWIHGYWTGEGHADPWIPDTADDEYKLLAERCVSNWCPLLVSTPAQALYVDGFRKGRSDNELPDGPASSSAEWQHWQNSRLDGRQAAIYRGALMYGHSFAVTEKDARGRVITKGLSPRKTAALFEDPANDETPYAALTVTKWPRDVEDNDGETRKERGEAWLWDGTRKYKVTFLGLRDEKSVSVRTGAAHGASECPVTRFAAMVDLDGRTWGVIEPMVKLQDRINQTVFDLLVAQTYTSSEVRTVTGMAPPLVQEWLDENGEVTTDMSLAVSTRNKLDASGNPIPAKVSYNRRLLFAEDPDAEFGHLPGGPLAGFIESVDMSIRHLAAISQTPPHHLLGQIANLSAEALQAAETALSRKIEEYRTVFGEAWERVFRLAGELSGDTASADDYAGEVLWRDMEAKNLSGAADALGKLRSEIQAPIKGLWKMVPGMTQNQFEEWEELRKEEEAAGELAEFLNAASSSSIPNVSSDELVAA